MGDVMLTPVNTMSRENLKVLVRNNILNNSLEFLPDCDMMETDSPVSKPKGRPIGKRLFHSPAADSPKEVQFTSTKEERVRKAKKRKQILFPDNDDGIKSAYIKECEQDAFSPDTKGGARKKVLVSLFHKKEYCMQITS